MPDAVQRSVLMLVAGARGAIGSTLSVAAALLARRPELVRPYLTTSGRFPVLGEGVAVAGWDMSLRSLPESLRVHGVVPETLWGSLVDDLEGVAVRPAPGPGGVLGRQVEQIAADIQALREAHPTAAPVLVDLLPSCPSHRLDPRASLDELLAAPAASASPDLAYALAALRCGVPVVNFTPNAVALPAVVAAAEAAGLPLAGRDGKTGQTYFKVVLASALKARQLYVDGWYSLNILGNADGANLMDPACAAGKLANKTQLLDEVLGYRVGERYDQASHKVHIDYYPPRGDAKEAWDVIDFQGLFGLPMSIRVNLQGRDSILAAPMAMDLARWMAAARRAGLGGLRPELAFFFKKPEGPQAPVTFQAQLARLEAFGARIDEALRAL
jgi:myo-inositol-1-phosphate synthase